MSMCRSLDLVPVLLATGLVAAFPAGQSVRADTAARLDPSLPAGLLFQQLEERLLGAPALRLRYAVSSEGAFHASLAGTLELLEDGTAALHATGTFGDAPVTLHLRSDGPEIEGGAGERAFRQETPPALREALILGLTRMGVLHNLARLTAGAPPDHAAGGVREWVEVREVQSAPSLTSAEPGRIGLAFPIFVSGQRTAEATLWIDPQSGMPVQRVQTVSFPGGSMQVLEVYEPLP
jgi:hypothetical protein